MIYCSVFSLVLVSIENIYKTLNTVFDKESNLLVLPYCQTLRRCQNSSAARRIFSSLLSV